MKLYIALCKFFRQSVRVGNMYEGVPWRPIVQQVVWLPHYALANLLEHELRPAARNHGEEGLLLRCDVDWPEAQPVFVVT